MKQCTELEIPFVDTPESGLHNSDLIVDAIFGFSFSGDVRQPFVSAIEALKTTKLPIVSVDIPSAWDVEKGNVNEGFQPTMLVSLTAPKEGAKDFQGPYHYLGGRFISKQMDRKWGLNLPEFPGTDQCVKLENNRSTPTSTSTSGSSSTAAPTTDTKKNVGDKMDRHFMENVVSNSFA
ncbi:hypothetical protein BGZ54_000145 [Gamsiella multidivaricata]|nr:hypothetical protein BGZ54_000145 [Gamsiella multidivaricata]